VKNWLFVVDDVYKNRDMKLTLDYPDGLTGGFCELDWQK
jgi:hypothetical protein